jgi:hypothetical protein
MIDGAIRDAVETAIRFLQPGAAYRFGLDDHDVELVRLQAIGPSTICGYLAICHTCRALVGTELPWRRAYLEIHKHPTEEIDHG